MTQCEDCNGAGCPDCSFGDIEARRVRKIVDHKVNAANDSTDIDVYGDGCYEIGIPSKDEYVCIVGPTVTTEALLAIALDRLRTAVNADPGGVQKSAARYLIGAALEALGRIGTGGKTV